MFQSMDAVNAVEAVIAEEPVIAGETVEPLSEVSPVSLEEDSPQSNNKFPVEITWKFYMEISYFSDLTYLRVTAAVSAELRAASEEAKRDMPIISLNDKSRIFTKSRIS